ncbi:protein of unknown function [Pararobbsia alpina]
MNLSQLDVPYFYLVIVKGIVTPGAVCIDLQANQRHA